MNKKYAVIKSGTCLVDNTIVAPEGFSIDGYDLILLDKVSAQPGAYYNPDDGCFYGDRDYQTDYRQITLGN